MLPSSWGRNCPEEDEKVPNAALGIWYALSLCGVEAMATVAPGVNTLLLASICWTGSMAKGVLLVSAESDDDDDDCEEEEDGARVDVVL